MPTQVLHTEQNKYTTKAGLIAIYKHLLDAHSTPSSPALLGNFFAKRCQFSRRPLPQAGLRLCPRGGPGPGPDRDSEPPLGWRCPAGACAERLSPSLGAGGGDSRENESCGGKGPNPEITRMWSPRAHAQCVLDKLAATTRPWSSSLLR